MHTGSNITWTFACFSTNTCASSNSTNQHCFNLQHNNYTTFGPKLAKTVQSLWGFRSVFYLTTPFSRPPAITLTDTPSGWLENATEQMISRQWTWPIKSPLIVHSLKSLPPPTRHIQRTWNAECHSIQINICLQSCCLQCNGFTAKLNNNKKRTDCHLYCDRKHPPESQTVAISPVVSLADTAFTGLLWPVRLWT